MIVTLRERVRDAPRGFCCAGLSKSDCASPQYPKDSDPDESGHCKSFRCTRCKGTVGWCKGADHGDDEVTGAPKKSNGWCDDCWAEVYSYTRDALIKGLFGVWWIRDVECEEYNGAPAIMLTGPGIFRPNERETSDLISKVRYLRIKHAIYIDVGNEKICLTTNTS